MKRASVLLAALILMALALPSAAGAKHDPPKENPNAWQAQSCVAVPGNTTVSWGHERVTHVEITWLDAAENQVGMWEADWTSKKPFGTVSVATPVGAYIAGMHLEPYGGGQDDEPCTPASP